MTEYPLLMIVPNLSQTESEMRKTGFPILNVDDAEGARQAVLDLQGVSLRTPAVLSDVSCLGDLQSLLLKLVEEFEGDLILLASRDNLNSVLMSRMARVVKVPNLIPFEYNDPKRVREVMVAEDGKFKVTLEDTVKGFPLLARFLYHFQTSGLPVREKLIDLFLGEES